METLNTSSVIGSNLLTVTSQIILAIASHKANPNICGQESKSLLGRRWQCQEKEYWLNNIFLRPGYRKSLLAALKWASHCTKPFSFIESTQNQGSELQMGLRVFKSYYALLHPNFILQRIPLCSVFLSLPPLTPSSRTSLQKEMRLSCLTHIHHNLPLRTRLFPLNMILSKPIYNDISFASNEEQGWRNKLLWGNYMYTESVF